MNNPVRVASRGARLTRSVAVRAAALLSLAACFHVGSATAAVLQVSPVRIEFASAQHAQALQVSNSGTRSLDAQVRIVRWSQEGGKDRFDPVDDLVASPAILQVSPGQTRVVRLVRLRPAPSNQQLSYRVFVDELPTSKITSGAGIKVLMRYSIPLFVEPASANRVTGSPGTPGEVPPTDLSQVQSKLVAGPDGKSSLLVNNSSAYAIRISDLVTSGPSGGQQSLVNGLVGYVLPGQQMAWPINVPFPPSQNLILKARFNDDREARALPMGAQR
ncbi:molecular chaperone [Pandoraea captiosa]|uniref:Molecular chaperone n=2 Tax=Pandoraea captiosa TaxID=2508302 RepID=A0A5E4ZVR7_9BURK|nr:molecular chaperone [Pandoraea captiosa]